MLGPLADLERQLVQWGDFCCGTSRTTFWKAKASAESESAPLLEHEAGPMHAPVVHGGMVAPPPAQHVQASAGPSPGLMLVMRHGHRADEDDDMWTSTAGRPWDPPLSMKGRAQARSAALELASNQHLNRIEYIITSPYLRCLQTSAEAMAALGLPKGRWLVDWSMGEIGEPRLLLSGRHDVAEVVDGLPLERWMWAGATLQQALDEFMQVESGDSGVHEAPVSLHRPAPPYPEEGEEAVMRYERELEWLAGGGNGQLRGNCLVVTHGEAVRTAVNIFQPDATVYEVRHCSQAVLARDAAPAHVTSPARVGALQANGWRLTCKSGETGINWFC